MNVCSRIIDANLNRLAEGLRVVEDLCRFGLSDTDLAGGLKRFRHAAGRLRGLLPAELSARDSTEDIGREKIPEPARRRDLTEILGASFGRIAESLRVLEEMAKLDRPEAAAQAKSMRYECYELEKRVRPAFDRKQRIAHLRGLYLVMTRPAVGYEELTRIAVKARVKAVQLREKEMDGGELLGLARRLRELTRGSETLFFINDRPDIARLCEADGLHLGQTDLSVRDARVIAGDRILIGKSTHNLAQLKTALAEGPDYVAIGPVFATHSKANPDRVLRLEKAVRMLRAASLPAVAIGGIDENNLPGLLAAGFPAYALIACVNASPRPLATIRRLKSIESRHE